MCDCGLPGTLGPGEIPRPHTREGGTAAMIFSFVIKHPLKSIRMPRSVREGEREEKKRHQQAPCCANHERRRLRNFGRRKDYLWGKMGGRGPNLIKHRGIDWPLFFIQGTLKGEYKRHVGKDWNREGKLFTTGKRPLRKGSCLRQRTCVQKRERGEVLSGDRKTKVRGGRGNREFSRSGKV